LSWDLINSIFILWHYLIRLNLLVKKTTAYLCGWYTYKPPDTTEVLHTYHIVTRKLIYYLPGLFHKPGNRTYGFFLYLHYQCVTLIFLSHLQSLSFFPNRCVKNRNKYVKFREGVSARMRVFFRTFSFKQYNKFSDNLLIVGKESHKRQLIAPEGIRICMYYLTMVIFLTTTAPSVLS